jgi:hypothetical protein
MKPGSKNVHVYAYENGALPDWTSVGRVFVDDLDDWDLKDKLFVKSDDPFDMFRVEQVGGMLQMNGQKAKVGNTYTVTVDVKDTTRPSDGTVKGTVTVNIL